MDLAIPFGTNIFASFFSILFGTSFPLSGCHDFVMNLIYSIFDIDITYYAIGKIRANRNETTTLVKPTIASNGVQDLSPSASVRPVIFPNIQTPLSFIHEPIIEPPPMAVAR